MTSARRNGEVPHNLFTADLRCVAHISAVMLHVLGCITEQHDLRLVMLAVLLCAFSAFTAVNLVLRAHLNDGRTRRWWILAAGVVVGAGIWGTHFITMLAYRSVIPLGYDVFLSVLSIAI